MSSRRNYLDADNSIMERNLRFVKNDLEENLNQYFGGSGSRSSNNSTTVTAPPRDYKVVQPKPGGSHAQLTSSAMEKRREFLLQLGLARHEAYELAKKTNFDVNDYQVKCQKWINNGVQLIEVNKRILNEIRNGNVSRNESLAHRDAGYFGKHDDLQHNDRGYNEVYENRSVRYRSRSRSPSYAALRIDQREEQSYQPSRSRSPNRDFISTYGRKNEQSYFPGDEFRRREIRNGSPPRNNRRKEYERSNEEYFLRQDNSRRRHRSRSYSPLTNDHRPEEFPLSRSRSSNKYYDEGNSKIEYDHGRPENYIIDLREDRMRKQSRSPLRRDHSSRSRDFDSMQGRENAIYFSEHKNFRNDVRKDISRERSRSRSYSPFNYELNKEHFQSARSHSPARGFNDRFGESIHENEEHFQSARSRSPARGFNDHFGESIHERSRSRPYSPLRNDRNEELYYSSKSRSPNRRINQDFSSNDLRDEVQRDTKHFDNFRETSVLNRNMFQQPNREIPSLLTLDVFGNQTQISQGNSHNSHIPSLLSLNVIPDPINFPQPSTSAKRHHFNQESKIQHGYNKPTKYDGKGNNQQIKRGGPNTNVPNSGLKQHIAEVPVIQSGLKKPLPGKLKFDPQDYWSQWWPTYKYIEYSIPKINPNDNELETCLKFSFKPHSFKFRNCKNLLLNKGVKTIMKTVDINETNYYVRDIYKLFKYKKHLEDPTFQNHLSAQELNCIAPALRQFQIKSTMAYLHQAIICRWHISLDIIRKVQAGEPILSNYARILLNDKCFHYLVKESINELKKMCQQDWPQFGEFYKNIKAKKVNIYAMGVGPQANVNNKITTTDNIY